VTHLITPLEPVLREAALSIRGGRPLRGTFHAHTAKNSALYLILAALLTREPVLLRSVPKLSDVSVLLDIVRHVGATARWQGHDLYLHAPQIERCEAPYHLVSQMRASFVALGALLGRCGTARVSMPGGCAFGPRPVDRHIKALAQLGVEVREEGGDFIAVRSRPLQGRAVFEAPTVGGTQNILLASALGEGQVVIDNAALEPEVADLITMLNAMGARISGAGTSTLEVQSVPELHGVIYTPIPDRIEIGTLMLATAATRGQVTLHDVNPEHLRAVIAKLTEAGVEVAIIDQRTLHVDATGPLKAVDVTAVEYPGVPTDLQAPFGAFLATVPGVSNIVDRVYPDRFTHVGELSHTGARLELHDRTLIVSGGKLHGAAMHAADIRAGGALIVAALAAEGESRITGIQFVERGYEALPERLVRLGADIRQEAAALATGTYGD